MGTLSYRSRIHKNKLTWRSLRYVAADQMVRLFPPLRERWLFPTEAVPMAEAAVSAEAYPTCVIETAPPALIAHLVNRAVPLNATQKVYHFENAVALGQSGAMLQDGRLLAVRPKPNWAISLRPRRHRLIELPPGRLHYALLPPVPAIGHVFHWLFDYVVPFMSWLEQRPTPEPVSPVVNATPTEFQRRTLDFLTQRYDLLPPVPVGADEAVHAPRIATSVLEPFSPRALQTPAGLAMLAPLADYLSEGRARRGAGRRIFISRKDAKLRRVVNEDALEPLLQRHGFERHILKGKPIAEQVRLFMEAEAVVAPHGAGLAHIAWCEAGVPVCEFFPAFNAPRGAPKNATSDFWIVSMERGLRYRAMEAAGRLNKHDLFEIPEPYLETALDWARRGSREA